GGWGEAPLRRRGGRERAQHRRERGDRRRARRVHPAAADRAGADARRDLHPPPAGVLRARRLVRDPALGGRLRHHSPRAEWRRRVLRPHRRLPLRSGDRLPGGEAAAAEALPVNRAEVEEHVRRALDSPPPRLAAALENVAVVVEEYDPDDPELFGLWESHEFLPDKITIYRKPLVQAFSDPRELEEEIRVTVLHELAHYFGIDEGRLEELGYD